MGTTTGLALPYPEGSDPVTQGDDAIKALALKVDGLYVREPETSSIANGVVASTGWTLGVVRLARWGPFRSLWVVVVRSGAAVGPGTATGDVTDVPILTGLPTAYRPLGGAVMMGLSTTNTPGGAALLGTDGSLTLISWAPTSSIATSAQIRGNLVYDIQVGA